MSDLSDSDDCWLLGLSGAAIDSKRNFIYDMTTRPLVLTRHWSSNRIISGFI